MKAIINTRYGGPEVLQLREVPKPVPKDDEVLIKIYASTVNRTDCGFLRASPFIVRFFSGMFKPKNLSLGNEFAGEIESTGSEVTGYKTGDRVFCFNDEKFGGHAQYMTIRADKAFTIMPAGMSYQQAAPLTEGSHYALGEMRAAKVKAGQNVLVNGATGAIGSAAVQLLKYFGTTVTAVCATPHMELVRALGADKVIDYTKEDFTLINDSFDFVLDSVGKSSFSECKRILAPQGIYISTELGKRWDNPLRAIIGLFSNGKRVMFPLFNIKKEDVLLIKELVETGKFAPVIDRTYSLEQVPDAYRYVELKQKIGNVVINITHD
jgi:NADPH:quinone reductase-like Zn-dependent oxidoreductase